MEIKSILEDYKTKINSGLKRDLSKLGELKKISILIDKIKLKWDRIEAIDLILGDKKN